MKIHIPVFLLYFFSALSLSQTVLAQVHSAKDAADDIKETAIADDDKQPPVEIGVGGTIEKEKEYRTRAESLYKWHAHIQWESRYVSEGRDNLSGDGLFSLSSELSVGDITFIPWLAHSPDADYSELNLNFIYATFLTPELLASLSYTYLHFRDQGDDSSDNEISLDLGYEVSKQLTAIAVVYHSFEAEGAFMEGGASYFYEYSDRLHFNITGLLGINAGYISDGHDGLNTFQVIAGSSFYTMDRLELYASANYNLAINRDVNNYSGDELLGDFFWAGVGINYLF